MIAVIAAIAGGGLVGSVLVYVATRKRDAPIVAIEARKAEITGAAAASEAWAEYAAAMETRLQRTEDHLEQVAAGCKDEIEVLKHHVAELEASIAAG